MKNQTQYKSFNRYNSDPRVVSIYNEDEDGIWVDLASGYNWNSCSSVHEFTCSKIHAAMQSVQLGEVL
tara:strand:+ start:704 stop:907 length:204 start_codon:yes stop_codon:yes gene_type:complete